MIGRCLADASALWRDIRDCANWSDGVPSFTNRMRPRQIRCGQRIRKVMVVDDAAFMRMRCKKMLIENGFDVVEAANGIEAISVYKESQPDMVLMDITMPDMDGLAALKEIKKIDPNAKVAMVTAMGQQALVMEALKTGALDFVIKPFDQERVLGTIKKALG